MNISNVNQNIISEICSITDKKQLQEYAKKNGLNILNITWEDTGRSKNSCWGPNISDMTLRLDKVSKLLPVIRHPNFSDKTAELLIDQFQVSVGNEKGEKPTKIPLKTYLQNPNDFIKSDNKLDSLFLEERDKQVLVSAQFCILPLEEGSCEFNVNIFNYQSSLDNPAVLVLICSQQGTSAQILPGSSPLYFNDNGKACNFIAERMKDVRKREGKSEATPITKDEEEKNCLFIYQIPLKYDESNVDDGECEYEKECCYFDDENEKEEE